jgi:hypothetical protein
MCLDLSCRRLWQVAVGGSTVRVTAVPDVSHYTVILGGLGVRRVADAVERGLVTG